MCKGGEGVVTGSGGHQGGRLPEAEAFGLGALGQS